MTRYVIVCTLQKGIIEPPEPVRPQTQDFLERQDRVAESLLAERIHWDDRYNLTPKRRRTA